jgi:hypothetical protein
MTTSVLGCSRGHHLEVTLDRPPSLHGKLDPFGPESGVDPAWRWLGLWIPPPLMFGRIGSYEKEEDGGLGGPPPPVVSDYS